MEEDKKIYKTIANVIINELMGLLKKHKITIAQCNTTPCEFSFLCQLFHKRRMNKKQLVAILDYKIDSTKARALTEEEQVFLEATNFWVLLCKKIDEMCSCGVMDSTAVS